MRVLNITEKNPIKGYKIFLLNDDNTLSCRDFKFDESKVNIVKGEIRTCSSGLHFCCEIKQCFRYYERLRFKINGKVLKHVVCEVEGWGEVDSDCSDKHAVSHLKIKRRLTAREVYDKLELFSIKKQDIVGFHYNKPTASCVSYVKNSKSSKMLDGRYLAELEKKEISFKYFNSCDVNIRYLIINRKNTITKVLYKVKSIY
jgi:hypothetical protein